MTFEWYNILIFLFFAKYGVANSEETCGYGSTTAGRTTGSMNDMGMQDTTKSTGAVNTNFWGLENLWSNRVSMVGNVKLNGSKLQIYEPVTGTLLQTLPNTVRVDGTGIYSKRYITSDLYTYVGTSFPTGNSGTGWCDYWAAYSSSDTRAGFVGGGTNDGIKGISMFQCGMKMTSTSANQGSRLSFTGNIIEETNTSTYKSLTVT